MVSKRSRVATPRFSPTICPPEYSAKCGSWLTVLASSGSWSKFTSAIFARPLYFPDNLVVDD
jgi:hypothetical protein